MANDTNNHTRLVNHGYNMFDMSNNLTNLLAFRCEF